MGGQGSAGHLFVIQHIFWKGDFLKRSASFNKRGEKYLQETRSWQSALSCRHLISGPCAKAARMEVPPLCPACLRTGQCGQSVSASPGPELSPGTCSLKEMIQTSQDVMLYLRHGYRKGINSKRPTAEFFGFLKQCLFH